MSNSIPKPDQKASPGTNSNYPFTGLCTLLKKELGGMKGVIGDRQPTEEEASRMKQLKNQIEYFDQQKILAWESQNPPKHGGFRKHLGKRWHDLAMEKAYVEEKIANFDKMPAKRKMVEEKSQRMEALHPIGKKRRRT